MFKAGQSGNPSGRPQGAKDKAQANIKQAYQSLVEGNLSNIETWLKEVASKDPAKALDFMLKISEFIVPKMKAVDLKTDYEDKTITVTFQSVAGMTREEIKELSPGNRI